MDIVDIGALFDEVARQMRSDLDKAGEVLRHPGLKGASCEEVLRQFLREYFPRSLDISTGALIDSHGRTSRQLDVIIHDAARTPVFYRSQDVRVIPVECAYAVVEVKSYLDRGELTRAFENMQSVRSLEKKAYIKPTGVITHTLNMYGKEWDIWPLNYFVFAFDSTGLTALASSLDQRHRAENRPEWSRIDSICVLNRGVICNRRPDGLIDALPQPGSRVVVVETDQALLLFYVLIAHYANQVTLPPFELVHYLRDIHFGQAVEVADDL